MDETHPTSNPANPLAPFWYEPEGSGQRFKLRSLTPFEYYDTNAAAVIQDGQTRMTAASARAALRAGLLDWQGVRDAAGSEVPMSRDMDANAELLGIKRTNEIITEIISATLLKESARKN